MEPKFVTLPEKKVVGLGTKFVSIMFPENNDMTIIPALWGQFIAQMGSIGDRVGHACFGVVEHLPGSASEGEMFYIACVEVANFDSVPKGMVHRAIPAGRFAVFTHKGKLDRIGQTMDAIYKDWLPKSGLKRRQAADLELYDQRFDPHSEESEFDIMVPIQ
jgi:AraC family transcriptional regulator